jgi:hypothetical protein
LILSIFFIGCNSSNTPIVLLKKHKVQNLPSWYLNAPNNNQDFLYGVGAASTLSQAKNEALNSLASRLFISVSSNTHFIKNSDSFENYSNINNQEIFLEVEKIDLLNSKIEKSIKVNDEYFVLLSIKNFDAIVSSFENINYSKYNNWFIAKCNISVEILVNSEVLSTNNFTIIGRSTHSNFQALENAKKSFEKKLLNIDINNFLGIK